VPHFEAGFYPYYLADSDDNNDLSCFAGPIIRIVEHDFDQLK
jgi:hypothetical protein